VVTAFEIGAPIVFITGYNLLIVSILIAGLPC